MTTMPTRAGMLLALSLLAAPAAAQLSPTPLEPTHPNAVRAAAVVERIIAGDRAGAAEVLRREGEPGWVAAAMERELDGPWGGWGRRRGAGALTASRPRGSART